MSVTFSAVMYFRLLQSLTLMQVHLAAETLAQGKDGGGDDAIRG